jgi:hypothetical protein
MTGLLIFFAAIGLLATLALLLLGVWLVVAGDRMDEHWPVGLDARDERDAAAWAAAARDPEFHEENESAWSSASGRTTRVEFDGWDKPVLDVQNHIGDSRPLR